jgi:hypothetical protein
MELLTFGISVYNLHAFNKLKYSFLLSYRSTF